MQRAGKSNCTEQLKESEVTKNHASFRLFCKLKSSTCVLPVAPGLTPRSLPPRQPLPPQLGCESRTSSLQNWKGLRRRQASQPLTDVRRGIRGLEADCNLR